MKKIVICTLIGLLYLSCSVSAPDNSSSSLLTAHSSLNSADLEKEYKSFSTKALSDAYVSRMFNKFLTISPNPTQVIRELEFARYLKDVKSDTTYFDSLKTFIGGDIAKFNLINNTAGVSQKKSTESATFGVFVDSLNPNTNNIVASGLVLNLDAGNASSYSGSGTIWTDLTGNSNIGTLINGSVFDSGNQGSLIFDGINDYVELGRSSTYDFNQTNSFSFGGWFYVQSNDPNAPFVGKWGTNTLSNGSYLLWDCGSGTNKVCFGVGSGASTTALTLPVNYSYNTWNYFMAVYTAGTKLQMYVNGNMLTYVNYSGNVNNPINVNLRINKADYDNSNFVGKVSIIQVYNKALSASEILQNYNALKGRYGL